MTRRPVAGWRVALSLFTVIPAGVTGELDDGAGGRAIRWLPAVGFFLGGTGGCVILAVGAINPSGPGRLLGAALAVAIIAGLTGGLHLDGLADTADGLGSRRPAASALEVMRRSDVGPMGVATLVLTLLIQVSAVAAVPRIPLAAAALVLAEVTGRVSVVLATGSPAARPGGFGALVAGQTTAQARALAVTLLLLIVAGAGLLAGAAGQRAPAGGIPLAASGPLAAVAGLLAGRALQQVAVKRLGGTTGDIFGAILQMSATTALVTWALLT